MVLGQPPSLAVKCTNFVRKFHTSGGVPLEESSLIEGSTLAMKTTQAPDYSFNRVFNKMHRVLVESDFRASYVAAKQRTKQRLYDAFSSSRTDTTVSVDPPAAPSVSAAASFTAAELEPLYGEYGLFRVSITQLCLSSACLTRAFHS